MPSKDSGAPGECEAYLSINHVAEVRISLISCGCIVCGTVRSGERIHTLARAHPMKSLPPILLSISLPSVAAQFCSTRASERWILNPRP